MYMADLWTNNRIKEKQQQQKQDNNKIWQRQQPRRRRRRRKKQDRFSEVVEAGCSVRALLVISALNSSAS